MLVFGFDHHQSRIHKVTLGEQDIDVLGTSIFEKTGSHFHGGFKGLKLFFLYLNAFRVIIDHREFIDNLGKCAKDRLLVIVNRLQLPGIGAHVVGFDGLLVDERGNQITGDARGDRLGSIE